MGMMSFKPSLTLKGRKFKWLGGFSGKPFHPPLTDIPSGAYIIAPILDIASYAFSDRAWAPDTYRAAGFIFLIGAVFGALASLTGFNDWLTTRKGTQIRRMANAHAWTMIVMSLLVAFMLYTRFVATDLLTPSLGILILSIVIALFVTVGGTIGGSMVFDFGMNVEIADPDHPVYKPHAEDMIHPHDAPPSA